MSLAAAESCIPSCKASFPCAALIPGSVPAGFGAVDKPLISAGACDLWLFELDGGAVDKLWLLELDG
eukprot:CAMPEP_0184297216 /NCGR_PEP_ID=MMETSP1049-20130417/8145_1 /TAXON_ID=77928 /ORGANISM="Proteomonas sulcata, Strain CCMP704" /LENGTH=66 /DNA_ID=CAMNT_0026606839 /DNA_START=878 /DNA_END=1078 /DNA_ORIENTATION=-